MGPIYAPNGQLKEATFRVYIYRGIYLVHEEKVRLSLVEWDKTQLYEKLRTYLSRLEDTYRQKHDPCPEKHPMSSKYDMVDECKPTIKKHRSGIIAISWTGRPEIDGANFSD